MKDNKLHLSSQWLFNTPPPFSFLTYYEYPRGNSENFITALLIRSCWSQTNFIPPVQHHFSPKPTHSKYYLPTDNHAWWSASSTQKVLNLYFLEAFNFQIVGEKGVSLKWHNDTGNCLLPCSVSYEYFSESEIDCARQRKQKISAIQQYFQ